MEQDDTPLLFLPESWYLDGIGGLGSIWTYIGKASRSRVHWDLEFKMVFSSFLWTVFRFRRMGVTTSLYLYYVIISMASRSLWSWNVNVTTN